MAGTVSILAREISARREVLLVATAAAVIALLMPLMPGLGGYRTDDVWTVASNTLALAVGWGLAVLFGATVFGRDLSEGRLGFYFARPVSGLAVWWGRMLGAYLLILASETVALLPSFFGGIRVIASSTDWGWPAAVAYLVMPLMLLLLAHAVGVMVRARTAWLVIDVIGFAVFPVVAWTSLRPLLVMSAEKASWVVVSAFAVALFFSLAAGGAVGLATGRVDLSRTHRALSLALWGTLALCTLCIAGYSHWLRDIGPPEFDDVDVVSVAPDGRWVEVFGYSRMRLDTRRRCLISTVDNRWFSLPERWDAYSMDVLYSGDGSIALWLGKGVGDGPRTVWWANLQDHNPLPRQTSLVVPTSSYLTLSEDGDRLAILDSGTLSVIDLPDERLVTAIRLSADLDGVTVLFPSEEILRLFARVGHRDEQSLLILEVQVATGKVVQTGTIENVGDRPALIVDRNVDHLIVRTRSEDGVTVRSRICDATDGSLIRRISANGLPLFLRDGRLVSLHSGDSRAMYLVVESVTGENRMTYPVDGGSEVILRGEAIPNGVLLSRLEDPADRELGRRIDLLDVDSGEVRAIGRHLRRAVGSLPWQRGTAAFVIWYRNDPRASRLFMGQTGALLRWDPESGDLVHVIGREEAHSS